MLSDGDNVTGDKETIEVKVTDCYLAVRYHGQQLPDIAGRSTTLFFSEQSCFRTTICSTKITYIPFPY